MYSHWLGVPDILSVVVSRTVIVTCRPDFGFPSPSWGNAYTGLTLRALLNSSRRLSTDGRWICSSMSCDKPGLLALPFTGAVVLDWLTSTGGEKGVRKCRKSSKNRTHISSRYPRHSVRCSSHAVTSPAHSNYHLLPIHCRCCTSPSAEASMFAATNWKSVTLTFAEYCCTFHLTSCFHRPVEFQNVFIIRRSRKLAGDSKKTTENYRAKCQHTNAEGRSMARRLKMTWGCFLNGYFMTRKYQYFLPGKWRRRKSLLNSFFSIDDPTTPEMNIESE